MWLFVFKRAVSNTILDMFKPCFLIISYVGPDDDRRATLCKDLIKTLDEWFDLPILMTIRDWKGRELPKSKNLKIYHFDEPGITIARKFLRGVALASEYNYFIMLDDDTELGGDKALAKQYLKHLRRHPHDFAVTPIGPMLKLFGISREIFEQVDYAPFVNTHERVHGHWLGFEDAAFVGECCIRFPEHITFTVGLHNKTDQGPFSTNSTWLDDEAKKWLHLQYYNTRCYLLNLSSYASEWWNFLHMNYKLTGDFPADMLYPLNG